MNACIHPHLLLYNSAHAVRSLAPNWRRASWGRAGSGRRKRQHMHSPCSAPPAWNPQNVPEPLVRLCSALQQSRQSCLPPYGCPDVNWLRYGLQVKPGVNLSAEEAVRAQLDALAANDEPWHAMLDCKMRRGLWTAAADACLPLAGPTTA